MRWYVSLEMLADRSSTTIPLDPRGRNRNVGADGRAEATIVPASTATSAAASAPRADPICRRRNLRLPAERPQGMRHLRLRRARLDHHTGAPDPQHAAARARHARGIEALQGVGAAATVADDERRKARRRALADG